MLLRGVEALATVSGCAGPLAEEATGTVVVQIPALGRAMLVLPEVDAAGLVVRGEGAPPSLHTVAPLTLGLVVTATTAVSRGERLLRAGDELGVLCPARPPRVLVLPPPRR